MEGAYTGLHDRTERLEGDVHLAHGYKGRNEERQTWYIDHDDEAEERVEGAPAVNALLNAAIVPPAGYHGDVRALVKEQALPEDQLRLHRLSQSALEAYHLAYDKEHADNAEMAEDRDNGDSSFNEDEYASRLYEHLSESGAL
ncbi:hypothetical protein E8E12_010080 [Didymella heteroderae]|uniref:Uncharacterized protein n=1 Tax=Didymella heteroderae TaxID=1769908 RepID=A0A9P4WWY0_9PLEO|nr:hypothetical protein E8E12_010080 [Didymella heteroderae]